VERLQDQIRDLKQQRNAAVVAHYYQTSDVKEVADYVGDSLAMAQWAQKCTADVLVVAGVRFMAETAAVLVPNVKVLSPDPDATCSLAEGCPADEFGKFIEQHPNRVVVTYVNSSVEVKALSDITCTSSNALKVINSIPVDKEIIFAPDRNMGKWLQKITGRNITLWDATCEVHDAFSVDQVRGLKAANPMARIIAHPECTPELLRIADFIGSTSALLNYVSKEYSGTYIVVTEEGILKEMRQAAPHAKLIPAPTDEPNTCACGICPYMKMITLEKIKASLETLTHRIVIPELLRERAALPINKMMAL
jgi:quinolinate synthase